MLHKSRTFSCELTKLLECPVTFLTDHLTVDRFQISTHSHHPTFHGLHDLVDELMHHTSHLLCRAGGNGRCHRWHRQTGWCCGGIRHWQHRSQDRCRKCALQLGISSKHQCGMHNTSPFNFSMSPSQSLRVFEFLETQHFHDSNEFLRPAKPSTLPWLDFSMGSLPGMFCTPGAWPAANAGAATAAGTAVEPSAATAAGAGPSSGIVTGPCSKLNGIWARNKMKSQQN